MKPKNDSDVHVALNNLYLKYSVEQVLVLALAKKNPII
jgi:hypothetical protein